MTAADQTDPVVSTPYGAVRGRYERRRRGVPGHPLRGPALRPPPVPAARAARALGRRARRGRLRADGAETAVLRRLRAVPVRPGRARRRLPQPQRVDTRAGPGARLPGHGVAARRRPDPGLVGRARVRRARLRPRRRRPRVGQLPAGRGGLRPLPGRPRQPRPARPARRAGVGARVDRGLRRRPRPGHPGRPVRRGDQHRRPAGRPAGPGACSGGPCCRAGRPRRATATRYGGWCAGWPPG